MAFVCSERCWSWTEDLGQFAQDYVVLEPDLEQAWSNSAAQPEHRRQFTKVLEQYQQHLQAYLDHPTGMTLPDTLQTSSHLVSLAVRLDHDIRDASGHIWYHSGTILDPLQVIHYHRKLCFFNQDSSVQRQWLVNTCADPVHAIWVMEQGAFRTWAEQQTRHVYFDQYGYLAHRFSIRHLPAVVYQDGRRMRVDEVLP